VLSSSVSDSLAAYHRANFGTKTSTYTGYSIYPFMAKKRRASRTRSIVRKVTGRRSRGILGGLGSVAKKTSAALGAGLLVSALLQRVFPQGAAVGSVVAEFATGGAVGTVAAELIKPIVAPGTPSILGGGLGQISSLLSNPFTQGQSDVAVESV